MTATVPNIVNVTPSNGSIGIAIGDVITILFDQEMDRESLNEGTLVLTGPDELTTWGNLVQPVDRPGLDDEDILSSPYFGGYVKGTITYEKTGSSGGILDDNTEDSTGDGTLWRTKAIFTPDKPLSPNVEYKFIILGDENDTDAFDSGVKTRTVFDTNNTAVVGTGVLEFFGGYTGSSTENYVVEIITGGTTGNAEYIWYKESNPLTTYSGLTSTGSRELEDGIYVYCDPDGSFTVGDTFTVVAVSFLTLANNYEWSFSTGSGSILVPPSTSSTSGIDDLVTTGSGLAVSSSSPEDGGTNLVFDSLYTITITFDKNIESSTVSTESIIVWSESVNGDSAYTADGILDRTVSVSGAVITIDITPIVPATAQLYENNIVFTKILNTVLATDGTSLVSEQTLFFTTTYNPFYSSERLIRLHLGPVIKDVPNDAVNFAIFEASIMADLVSYSTTITNGTFFLKAKRYYTKCLACLILIEAITGDGTISAGMKKSLGDLSVWRDGNYDAIKDRMDSLRDCVLSWEQSIATGGAIAPGGRLKPAVSVKGANADDAIYVSRQWQPTTGRGVSSRGVGNSSVYASGRRNVRTFKKRR